MHTAYHGVANCTALLSESYYRGIYLHGHVLIRRAGGDRTHDRGIMTRKQTAGLVLSRRIGSRFPENTSGRVGLVRWCRIGMWDEMWA